MTGMYSVWGRCMFEPYLLRWNLVPDGSPIQTRSSRLLPVLQGTLPAMLNLPLIEEERRGGRLMAWWRGEGAARVLEHADGVLLLERATGVRSLSDMARGEADDAACRILCATASRLHAPRRTPPPELTPLACWFQALGPAARTHGGMLSRSAAAAEFLLSTPRELALLHGDLHHGNVLDFGDQGWLAIDPKGILGERGFDFANIFTNPDLADPSQPVAVDPHCFARRLATVTMAADLDRERLLLWIVAWCGLSLAWSIEDGNPAPVNLRVAELASAELDR